MERLNKPTCTPIHILGGSEAFLVAFIQFYDFCVLNLFVGYNWDVIPHFTYTLTWLYGYMLILHDHLGKVFCLSTSSPRFIVRSLPFGGGGLFNIYEYH